MKRAQTELIFKQKLASFTGSSEIYLFWKGRVALYVFLKAIGVGVGDEVILPAYTCVVVPNAILYLGATPVYVDINPETYCCDAADIETAITDRTKAIVCQNTYGLSWQVDAVAAIGKKYKIWTIEDCAHGFSGKFRNLPNGSLCDASFYSSQWNKGFSTGFGGYLQINTFNLTKNVNAVIRDEKFEYPSYLEVISLSIQLKIRKIIPAKLIWKARKLYRYLTHLNILSGSSGRWELESPEIKDGYLKVMAPIQLSEGINGLDRLRKIQEDRKRFFLRVHDELSRLNKGTIPVGCLDDHSYLMYPIRVKNRAYFFREAERSEIFLIDWFVSPLHPVEDLDSWKFDKAKFPNSMKASQECCAIPYQKDYDKVVKFINNLKEEII